MPASGFVVSVVSPVFLGGFNTASYFLANASKSSTVLASLNSFFTRDSIAKSPLAFFRSFSSPFLKNAASRSSSNFSFALSNSASAVASAGFSAAGFSAAGFSAAGFSSADPDNGTPNLTSFAFNVSRSSSDNSSLKSFTNSDEPSSGSNFPGCALLYSFSIRLH